jgi:hypothetical protein
MKKIFFSEWWRETGERELAIWHEIISAGVGEAVYSGNFAQQSRVH